LLILRKIKPAVHPKGDLFAPAFHNLPCINTEPRCSRNKKDISIWSSICELSLSVPVTFCETRYIMSIQTNDDTERSPFSSVQTVSKITL
jgi:hypothetical protein